MKPLTTLLIILCITCVFTVPSKATDKDKNEPAPLYLPSKTSEIIKKHLAEKGLLPELGEQYNLTDLFKQLIDIKTTGAFPGSLKSGTEKGYKLDSLLAERYNEYTGQLEPAQLERWTWNEEGLGESWELYDLDSASGQWFANDREEYVWDDAGNKITHTDFNPDSLKTGWVKNTIDEHIYDSNNRITLWNTKAKDSTSDEWNTYRKGQYTYGDFGYEYYSDQEWNNTEGQWDTTKVYILEYDSIGNVITEYYKEISPVYSFAIKINNQFDSVGNMTEQTAWMWDDASAQYLKYLNDFYTYNNNQATNIVRYWGNPTTGEWEYGWTEQNEYDSSSFLINYRFSWGIDSLGNPISDYKTEYINDELGQVTEKTKTTWSANDSAWINSSKYNYSYNTNKKKTTQKEWDWDTDKNDWIPQPSYNYDYDAQGNCTLENKMTWDTTSNNWQTNYQYDYIYDLSVEFSDIVFPPQNYPYAHLSNLKNQEQFTHLMLNKSYSEQIDNQLVTTEVLNFYYSENIKTGMVDFKQAELKVFPNPATNYVIFDGIETNDKACVNLYNLQGKKLLSKQLTSENRVSVNHLNTGLYIYELTSGTETFRGKFLKK